MSNNGNILTMLDSFVESVRLEKQAAEPTTALYSEGAAAAGLKNVVEGARSKENSEDTKEIGVSVKSEYPESIDNSAEGTVGTTDADGAPELTTKAQPDDKDVFGKAGHFKNLGNTILENIKKASEKPVEGAQAPAQVKKASSDEKISSIVKSASADADLYCDFLTGYAKGIQKSAMDGSEAYPEEAMAANPEAAAMEELAGASADAGVAPEAMDAAMGNEGGELSPEDIALLNELQAQGITLEDIAALLESQGAEGAIEGEAAPVDDVASAEAMAEEMPQEAVDAAV